MVTNPTKSQMLSANPKEGFAWMCAILSIFVLCAPLVCRDSQCDCKNERVGMDKVEEGGLGPLGDFLLLLFYLNCINLNGWLGFKGKIAYAG